MVHVLGSSLGAGLDDCLWAHTIYLLDCASMGFSKGPFGIARLRRL